MALECGSLTDQIKAFEQIHTRLHDQLVCMPDTDRRAVEAASRELRKARAVTFTP